MSDLRECKDIKTEDVNINSMKDIIKNAKNLFQINGAIHTMGYADANLSNDLRLMFKDLQSQNADINTIKSELLDFIPVTESTKITESTLTYTFEVYIDGLQPVMYNDDWSVNDAKKEYIENEGKGHDISEVKVKYFEEPLITEINESKSSEEEELAKLQTELRGVNVSELSEEEYKEYKDKSNRVQELINKLYNIRKLGEDINFDSQWDSKGINIKGWHLEEQESDQTGIIRHWLYNRQGLGGALTIYPDTIKELEDYIQKDKQIFGFEGGYIDPKVKEEIIKLIKNGKIKLSNRVQESVEVKTESKEYPVQGASDNKLVYNTVDDLMFIADCLVDEIMDITGESEEDIAMYLEEQGREVTEEDEGNSYLITDGDNEYYVSFTNLDDMEMMLDELIDRYLEFGDIEDILNILENNDQGLQLIRSEEE